MTTLALNAVVIAWVSLLLFSPIVLFRAAGRPSVVAMAATGLTTMAVLCLVGVTAARLEIGTVIPLRVCCILLTLGLIAALVRQFLRFRADGGRIRFGLEDLAVPGSFLIALGLLAPPLVELGRLGVRWGVATVYNADIVSYALSALNVGTAGFGNSHHLLGLNQGHVLNVGESARAGSYYAATMMINLVSAATGLSAWQAVFPAMGVSLVLVAISLWALAKAIWPTARYAAGGAAIVGAMASLPSFATSQYYLGATLGLASVAGGLAGATALARGDTIDRAALVCVTGGSALGVYAYSELGLPAVFGLIAWAALAFLAFGGRPARVLRVLAVSAGAAVVALLLSSVGLQTAVHLLRAQSKGVSGFRIPPLTASAAIVWPAGIRQAVNPFSMTVSWLLVLALVVAGCLTAWRKQLRGSAVLTAILAGGALLVMLGFFVHYGTDRYQTWKIEAFLLPMALAAIVPAIAMIRIGSASLGKAVVVATVGVVAISPILQWQAAIKVAKLPPQHGGQPFFSQRGFTELANSPQLKALESVNIHLAPLVETELAGSIVPVRHVNFTSKTYSLPQQPIKSCTLTRRAFVTDTTGAVDLGGGYILVPRPYPCELKK